MTLFLPELIDRDNDKMNLQHSLFSIINADESLITALSNTAALLYHSLENINWCGFYLFDGEKLVLGPFGGKPACTTIEMGKGVCGTAAKERRIIRVADVNEFPGHIACDPASQSEIVLPIILSDDTLFGVLDIDAPMTDRFESSDETELQEVVEILVTKIDAIRKRNSNTKTSLIPLI
jgi:L-methionine (R)-S-oxide reductase